MSYNPTIIVDDDKLDIRENFELKGAKLGINVISFSSWDKTKEYLDSGNPVDAIVLDARGKLSADEGEKDAHIVTALKWVEKAKIPYAIYTAFTDEMDFLSEEIEMGRVFSKGRHKEEDVFSFLKQEIARSPKAKYPEPFACFGGNYLPNEYQEMLMNVVLTLQNEELNNPEAILFNPCRIILESVFRKINDVDETVLPYSLVDFENQRIGLVNCSKYLNGVTVKIGGEYYSQRSGKVLDVHISQQIQTIIGICHPASHEIQKYSPYTFKSVLWAIFDVLIWLKKFVDERSY